MSAVLILGAIFPFCDLVEDVKEMGYEAVVCDYYTDAAAKKKADFSYDISTLDIESIKKIAKKHQVVGIISAFSDRNLMPNFQLATQLDLPCIYTNELIQLITNKDLMKEKLADCNVPIIKYKLIHEDFKDSDLEDISFPVIIKPVDSYGSKGIFVCADSSEIRDKFDFCTKESLAHQHEIIVEEYYPYDEISISIWVKNKTAHITCVYDVGRNFGENIVLSSIIYPSKYQRNYGKDLKQLSQYLVSQFGIKEGPVTIQCFIGPDGLRVSEILCRLAGGSPYLYPVLCQGPNTLKMLVNLCTDNPVDYQNLETFQYEEGYSIYDYKIAVSKPCILHYDFNETNIKQVIKQCIAVRIYRNNGEKIENIPANGETVMRIFCKVKDTEDQTYTSLFQKISEIVRFYDENHIDITRIDIPHSPIREKCYPLKKEL